MTCPRPNDDDCTDMTPCQGCQREAACFDGICPGCGSECDPWNEGCYCPETCPLPARRV